MLYLFTACLSNLIIKVSFVTIKTLQFIRSILGPNFSLKYPSCIKQSDIILKNVKVEKDLPRYIFKIVLTKQ